MAEIPRDEIIDLVKRCKGHVNGIGNVLAVKDAALDIALGEDRDLLGEFELFERFDKVQIAAAVRLVYSFELTLDKDRAACTILGKLVLPPTDSHIAAKGLTVVEVGADDRGFNV